ncbi:hypothetical protein BD414DRAFT_476982 [Trametes punicea]|nr:hypothetical protein BD414DRAFT_476982 [Trametes punicea]
MGPLSEPHRGPFPDVGDTRVCKLCPAVALLVAQYGSRLASIASCECRYHAGVYGLYALGSYDMLKTCAIQPFDLTPGAGCCLSSALWSYLNGWRSTRPVGILNDGDFCTWNAWFTRYSDKVRRSQSSEMCASILTGCEIDPASAAGRSRLLPSSLGGCLAEDVGCIVLRLRSSVQSCDMIHGLHSLHRTCTERDGCASFQLPLAS